MSLPQKFPIPGLLREKDWQRTVVEAAALHGWAHYHTRDSRGSNPGFPDLVLAHRKHGVIFVELKTESGRMTPAQRDWREVLRASGQRVFTWRPSDWQFALQVLHGSTCDRPARRWGAGPHP